MPTIARRDLTPTNKARLQMRSVLMREIEKKRLELGMTKKSFCQRKYIDAMEAKQAAKESDAAEREQANQIERGKALESAAQAMDSVRDVHGHRLGWMA